MDIFEVIFYCLAILAAIILIIPSLLMVLAIRWVAEVLLPKKNHWVHWAIVLTIILVMPQIFNVLINRDVSNILTKSQTRTLGKISAQILAVESIETKDESNATCDKDCALLLLSGEIKEYLVVRRNAETNAPDVTAFKFEEISDCPFVDFLGQNLSSKIENTIREMGLSGQCLTSTIGSMDNASIYVKHSSIEPRSWLLPLSKQVQTSISKRNNSSGDWEEIQRDIGIKYREVFPILLPVFSLDKRTRPIELVTTTKYQSVDEAIYCESNWFSEYGPCHIEARYESASTILGLSLSEHSLEQNGLILTKLERTVSLSKLVKGIISEERSPNPNEWALINKFISHEYYQSETFSELVLDVMSHDGFPVPSITHAITKLNNDDVALILAATMIRIGQDVPGPVIGDTKERQQWKSLYNIVKYSPTELVESHFDDLVKAVSKRPNKRQYVAFLERFGAKSRQPILDLLNSDKKRLSTLSAVMCKMGSDLSGIEAPILEMANNNDISIRGNYGNVIYLLLELGVQENELLGTVDPAYDSYSYKNIQLFINKYKANGKRCH